MLDNITNKLDLKHLLLYEKRDLEEWAKKLLEYLSSKEILADLPPDELKTLHRLIKYPEIDKPPVGCCISFGLFIEEKIGLRYPRITSIEIIESIHELYKNKKLLNCEYLEGFSEYPASKVYFLKETQAYFSPDYRVKNIPMDGNDDIVL